MSEMVERVARAMSEAFDREGRVFEDGQADMLAMAAIMAMREPSDEMLGSVYGACGEQRGSDRLAREVWQTMIDEALK